jgi:hypothetical protein
MLIAPMGFCSAIALSGSLCLRIRFFTERIDT